MTELPSGMRATRENRKMAASKLLKKVRAPAKKKFPARAQNFRIPEQPLGSQAHTLHVAVHM